MNLLVKQHPVDATTAEAPSASTAATFSWPAGVRARLLALADARAELHDDDLPPWGRHQANERLTQLEEARKVQDKWGM